MDFSDETYGEDEESDYETEKLTPIKSKRKVISPTTRQLQAILARNASTYDETTGEEEEYFDEFEDELLEEARYRNEARKKSFGTGEGNVLDYIDDDEEDDNFGAYSFSTTATSARTKIRSEAGYAGGTDTYEEEYEGEGGYLKLRWTPESRDMNKRGRGRSKAVPRASVAARPLPPPKPIEELTPDGDDTAFGYHLAIADPEPSIHTSQLDLHDKPDQAREIAKHILNDLDFNVARFFGAHKPKKKVLLERSNSSISVASSFGDIDRLYVEEPSTLNMFYEKGENELAEEPVQPLAPEDSVDAETQVRFHRSKKRFGRSPLPASTENFTQTREMTIAAGDQAERIFRHLYPLRDDYVPPKKSIRKIKMDIEIDIANKAKEDVDKAKVGPKVKWSKKQRLLPPLPHDYHKVESYWTGSVFQGKFVEREFDQGKFNYPLMSTYESEFHNGQIQTKHHLGCVTYPRGDKFEGDWRRGRHLAGRITFCDDLQFSPHHWKYCAPPDRRFFIERDVGVKQVGRTLYNDRLPPPHIPPGMYDTGDGIYNPQDGKVTGFHDGSILRTVDANEHAWITQNYRKSRPVQERYNPSFDVRRLPGCSADKFEEQ